MRRFIFGERSGIYIIDLEKTLTGLQSTYDFLLDVGRRGGSVLFVGTKKQAQEVVAREAGRVAMPFVNTRWLGGMLTNFTTIHGRLQRMKELREMERSGAFEYLPKKEVLRLRHEKEKLERNLSGIQDMERRPDAIFVIDTKREHIAVKEARKLGIPVLAIVDTNCDPDEVDYVIPGNARRHPGLFAHHESHRRRAPGGSVPRLPGHANAGDRARVRTGARFARR